MQYVLYGFAWVLVRFLQSLPLRWVARLGRFGGAIAYYLDSRHRKVALENLRHCFGKEMSRDQIQELAHENFRRIGENYASAVKTASMSSADLAEHVETILPEKILQGSQAGNGVVGAIGHFGNFEVYANLAAQLPEYRCATTFRALQPPMLNRLLLQVREQTGCAFFERRTQAGALKMFMRQKSVILGLLSDQAAGRSGLWLPFLGRNCWTSPAPAVFALRYQCQLYVVICYRVALARWRVECGPEIPTHQAGTPRTIEAITRDINTAFEHAVRRDPANWFWVHNRWKTRGKSEPPPSGTYVEKTTHTPAALS